MVESHDSRGEGWGMIDKPYGPIFLEPESELLPKLNLFGMKVVLNPNIPEGEIHVLNEQDLIEIITRREND